MRYLPLFVLLLLTACGTDDDELRAGCPGGYRTGDTFVAGVTALRLEMAMDNRCYCEADCIWEGAITLEVSRAGGRRDTLQFVGEDDDRNTVLGLDVGSLEIVAARPLRDGCAGTLPGKDFCFEFAVR